MKLDNITKFEVEAEAFHIMSGYIAPWKYASPYIYLAPHEEREAIYREWAETYDKCVQAMLLAFERVMPDEEDK